MLGINDVQQENPFFPFTIYKENLTNNMEQSICEKQTGSQLVKKCPAFYGNQRFITAFTSARHLSVS